MSLQQGTPQEWSESLILHNIYEKTIIFISDVLSNISIDHYFIEDAESLPETLESDIDIYVPRKDLKIAANRIISAFSVRGLELFRIIHNSYSTQIYLVDSKFSKLIHIDLMPEINYKGIVYLSLDEYMQKGCIRKRNDVPYLEHHQLYTYKYLRDLLQKGSVEIDVINNLLKFSPKKATRLLIESIKEIFNVNPYNYIDSELNFKNGAESRLRIEFFKNVISHHKVSAIQTIISHYLHLIKRWMYHPGFMICILGPDGVGKSSVIECMENTTIFDKSTAFYLLPGFLKRYRMSQKKENTANTDPHGRPRRSYLFSVFKVFVWLYEYYFGYYFIIKKHLFLGHLVVFDRYYSDIIIDQKRYRYRGSTKLLRLVNMLLPSPDATFILTASPEIIQSRKQEVPFDETKSQIERYLSYSNNSENCYIISTEQSIEKSTKIMNDIICQSVVLNTKKNQH